MHYKSIFIAVFLVDSVNHSQLALLNSSHYMIVSINSRFSNGRVTIQGTPVIFCFLVNNLFLKLTVKDAFFCSGV